MSKPKPLRYATGSELGPAELTLTANKELVDLSAGYQFTVDIADQSGVVFSKSTGITGAATAPNLTIDWSADDLDLEPGWYTLQVQARVPVGPLDWRWSLPLQIGSWAVPA